MYVKEQLRRCKKCLVGVVHTLLLSCVDKGEDSTVAGDEIDQVMSCLTGMASEKKWVPVNFLHTIAQQLKCWLCYSSMTFTGSVSFLKEFEKHFSLAACLDKLKQHFPALYPIYSCQKRKRIEFSTVVYSLCFLCLAIVPNFHWTVLETRHRYSTSFQLCRMNRRLPPTRHIALWLAQFPVALPRFLVQVHKMKMRLSIR